MSRETAIVGAQEYPWGQIYGPNGQTATLPKCARAREFHHMMLNTNEAVGLCLDAHWIYRGAGNREVALHDIVQRCGARMISLHLRQSRNGVWSETLEEGDINYQPLARYLEEMHFSGPIILEQAREDSTPQTMTPAAAHRRSAAWTRRVFGGVL